MYIIAMIIMGFAIAQPIAGAASKGDRFLVPTWQWVDVVNPTPLTQRYSNGDASLEYGETCGIESGGNVEIRGTEKDTALVEYTAPGSPMGTPCPSGVLFLIEIRELTTWPGKYAEVQRREQQRRGLVDRLLSR